MIRLAEHAWCVRQFGTPEEREQIMEVVVVGVKRDGYLVQEVQGTTLVGRVFFMPDDKVGVRMDLDKVLEKGVTQHGNATLYCASREPAGEV